jgi:hypothetical protein
VSAAAEDGAGPSLPPLGRNRDFLVLWSGQAVSELGSSMSVLVFPIVGYAITGSATLAGLATTAVIVGGVVTRLPAGALVDRWSRSRVLLAANVVAALAYASLGAAALAGALTLGHLIAVGVVSGVCDALLSPAAAAAVRTIVPPPQLPLAFTRLEARQHGAELIGPPVGGALYSAGRSIPFLVDAASYLVAAASVLLLRTPLRPPAREGAPSRVVADITEGVRFFWRQRALRAIILWGALVNFAVTLVLVLVTLRLVRAGVHPAAIGAIDTIGAVSALAGALLAPRIVQRARTGATTIVSGLLIGGSIVPMAWTTNVVAIGALLAAGFFLLPANNAGISAYMASLTPDGMQGRLNGAAGFLAEGLRTAGPVLAGVLLAALGGTGATLVGAGCAAASLLPLVLSGEVRRLDRPDRWPVAVQS